MRKRTWTPGGYPATVTERGIVVLEPGNEALAQRFWELMLEGADLAVLLQELTSAFAANLAALPSFVALIDESSEAHIAVRGAFEVVVDGPEGPTSVSGGSVITWSEHRFRTHSGWRIATPVDGPASEACRWQVISAVLPVATLASGTVGEVACGVPADSPVESVAWDEASPASSGSASSASAVVASDEASPASSGPASSASAVVASDEASPALGAPVPSAGAQASPEEPLPPDPAPVDSGDAPADGEGSSADLSWLAGASSGSDEPAGEADDASLSAEDNDSPAVAFFAQFVSPSDEEEESEPEDAAADPVIAQPTAPAPVPADDEPSGSGASGEETQIPWYEREDETPEPDPVDEAEDPDDDKPPLEATADDAADESLEVEAEDGVRSRFEYLYGAERPEYSVEQAAVRQIQNSDVIDDDPVPVPPSFASPPETEHREAPEPAIDDPVPPVPGQAVSGPPVSAAEPEPRFEPPPGSFFIDSVPGLSSGAPRAQEASPSAAYQRLAATQSEGDHDGQTMLPERARELREYARQIAMEPAQDTSCVQATSAAVGPQVLAVLCEKGHPNPTHASSCRICSSPLSSSSVTVPRPDLGRIILSTGEEVALDQDIIIGRRPRSTPTAGRAPARLAIVPSPGKKISRSHCELRIDDWDVRLHDLGSQNGTLLMRPGQAPVRLDGSVAMVLKPGDVVELGENISFRMEA